MALPSTRLLTTLAALAVASSYASPARASFMITGDPVADSVTGNPDSWYFAGNSLKYTKYIRGDGNFSFDMYRAQFLVSQASGLGGTGWLPGDSVIAMGGVIVNTAPAGFSNPTAGDPVNSNLTQHVRIVSKFTNTTSGFTPSGIAFAPDYGNGHGSFSAGDGGVGSILIATTTDTGLMTQQVTTAGAGVLTLAGINERWAGGVSSISSQHARFIYTIDTMGDSDPTNDRLRSWEVLLNRDSLIRALTPPMASPNTTAPDWDGYWNQGLQRGTNDFTDALNFHSPAPPTLVALAAGAGLLGLGRRLRRAIA